MRSNASGMATSAPAASAASPMARARSSTKARSSRAAQRDRARGRAHATAGAEQRDVSLVVGRPSAERRVEASGRGERLPHRRGIERAPHDADRATLECLAMRGLRTGIRDQEDSRVGSRGIARRERDRPLRRARSRPRAGCRHRRSEQAPATRSRAGRRAPSAVPDRAPRRPRAARGGRSRAVAAQKQPEVATARARCQVERDRDRRTHGDHDPARALARRREQLESARGDVRSAAVDDHDIDAPPGPEQAHVGRRRRRQLERHRPLAAAEAARTCPRRAAHRARGSRRPPDRSSVRRPANPPSASTIDGVRSAAAIGTATTSPSRTTPPAAIAWRSASTAVRGSPLPGARPSASATSASARPAAASQCSRSRSSSPRRFTRRPARPATAAGAA